MGVVLVKWYRMDLLSDDKLWYLLLLGMLIIFQCITADIFVEHAKDLYRTTRYPTVAAPTTQGHHSTASSTTSPIPTTNASHTQNTSYSAKILDNRYYFDLVEKISLNSNPSQSRAKLTSSVPVSFRLRFRLVLEWRLVRDRSKMELPDQVNNRVPFSITSQRKRYSTGSPVAIYSIRVNCVGSN